MKKYEAPNCEMITIADDIMSASGLLADLSSTFDARARDIFSDFNIDASQY